MFITLQEVGYDKKRAYEDFLAIRNKRESVSSSLRDFISNIKNKFTSKDDIDVFDEIEEAIDEEIIENKEFAQWFEQNRKEYLIAKRYPRRKPNEGIYEYLGRLKGSNAAARNNFIFDAQWGIITSEHSTSRLLKPGSFDNLKRLSRLVSALNNSKVDYEIVKDMPAGELEKLGSAESNLNILDINTQVYFFKQNMIAAKLIGIFANANVSHAFCTHSNITLNPTVIMPIKINGVSLHNRKFDDEFGINNTYVSNVLASFVAASVDAVKDPVFDNININLKTVNAALVLARFGVSDEDIALFTSHPVIKEYVRMCESSKDSAKDILDALKHKYGTEEEINVFSNKEIEITTESLANSLSGKENGVSKLAALVLFERLEEIAEQMRDLTYVTKLNSITDSVGPLFSNNMIARQRIENFINRDPKTAPLIGTSTILEKNPILESFYETTIGEKGAATLISAKHWKYEDRRFALVLKDCGIRATKSNIELIDKIYAEYVYYNMARKNISENGAFVERDKLLYFIKEFPGDYLKMLENIKENYPDVYKREIENNAFISKLKVVAPKGKMPFRAIVMESGKINGDLAEEIKDGWDILATSNNKEVRKLSGMLFRYACHRSGFKFNPNNFLSFATTNVKYSAENYIGLASSNKLFEYGRTRHFIIEFVRNHPDLLPYYKVNISSLRSDEKVKTIDNGVQFTEAVDEIIQYMGDDGVLLKPVITHKGKIYVNKYGALGKPISPRNSEDLVYVEVTKLGLGANAVEYYPVDSNEDAYESAISDTVFKGQEERMDAGGDIDADFAKVSDATPDVTPDEAPVERANKAEAKPTVDEPETVFSNKEMNAFNNAIADYQSRKGMTAITLDEGFDFPVSILAFKSEIGQFHRAEPNSQTKDDFIAQLLSAAVSIKGPDGKPGTTTFESVINSYKLLAIDDKLFTNSAEFIEAIKDIC